MAITLHHRSFEDTGPRQRAIFQIDFDNSYPTGGYSLLNTDLGINDIATLVAVGNLAGYQFDYNFTTKKIIVKSGSGGVTGATSAGTPAGTNTSSTNLDLATPAFSGTGLTAVGQVITTTDNQTMTLNQCAGMWLLSATGATPPNLILSNTAVTAAPAVLTVQGSANTDAGAYQIVKSVAQTFAGVLMPTHTHTVAAGASAEVANGTDLSTLTNVRFLVFSSNRYFASA